MLEGNTTARQNRSITMPASFGTNGEAEDNSIDRGLTIDDIAFEAYLIYQANGGHHGHDVEHWLEAERRLIERVGQQERSGSNGAASPRRRSSRTATGSGTLASASRRK